MVFDSREQAGQLVGQQLKQSRIHPDTVVGLARGGVVVASHMARILSCPLEAMVVRKIGAPGNPEYAIGAVAEVPGLGIQQSVVYWDESVIKRLRIKNEWRREQAELKNEEMREYRQQLGASRLGLLTEQTSVVITDDGAATGISMMAAIKALKAKGRLIVALPVASTDAVKLLKPAADELVVLHEDEFLGSVGQYYRQFSQVGWDEVSELIKSSRGSNP